MTYKEVEERLKHRFESKEDFQKFYEEVQNMDIEEKEKLWGSNLACSLNMIMISLE